MRLRIQYALKRSPRDLCRKCDRQREPSRGAAEPLRHFSLSRGGTPNQASATQASRLGAQPREPSVEPAVGGTSHGSSRYSDERRTARILLLGIAASVAVASRASAGNLDSYYMSGEAALQGGAVTADTQHGGAIWYNPAGLASISGSRLDTPGRFGMLHPVHSDSALRWP